MAEMPELVKLHKKWKNKGVRVQTVALDISLPDEIETAEGIGAFAAERGFDLPILAFDGDAMALVERYGLSGAVPVTLAIDADGEVTELLEGSADMERFEEMIRKALGS